MNSFFNSIKNFKSTRKILKLERLKNPPPKKKKNEFSFLALSKNNNLFYKKKKHLSYQNVAHIKKRTRNAKNVRK